MIEDLNPAARPASALMPAFAQDVLVLGFGACIVAALLAALLLWRRGDNRLLILLGAGAVAAATEGLACLLINCFHSPEGQYRIYRAFDTDVPLWLGEVYVLFFGAGAYLMIRQLQRLQQPLAFWLCFATIGLSEGVFEMITIRLGTHLYYGAQPWPIAGFPLHLFFVNATLAIAFATAAAVWFHFVDGLARYALIGLTLLLGPGIYVAMVMPLAAGLHSGEPALASAGSLMTIAAALAIALLCRRILVALAARPDHESAD